MIFVYVQVMLDTKSIRAQTSRSYKYKIICYNQSRNVTKYFYFVTLLKEKSLLFLSNEVHFWGSTFTCNEVQMGVLFLNVTKYS